MLPIVQNVVYIEGVSSNTRLGESYDYTHPIHVIACHVQAPGMYTAGREVLPSVRGPYLLLLPATERDCNGLVGPVKMYWCKFEWSGVKRGTGENVSFEFNGSHIHRSHLRNLNSTELHKTIELFRELQSLSKRPDLPAQVRAGAKVLGNIQIGDYAKIASGSVVLKPVPSGCTAGGVPARLRGSPPLRGGSAGSPPGRPAGSGYPGTGSMAVGRG